MVERGEEDSLKLLEFEEFKGDRMEGEEIK